MTGLAVDGTVHERQLVRQILEVGFNELYLSELPRLVSDYAERRLSYERIMVGCEEYGILIGVPLAMVEEWFWFGILFFIRSTKVHSVSGMVAVEFVAVVNGAALPDQEWFQYNYVQRAMILRQKGGSSLSQNAEGGEGEERGQSVVRPV